MGHHSSHDNFVAHSNAPNRSLLVESAHTVPMIRCYSAINASLDLLFMTQPLKWHICVVYADKCYINRFDSFDSVLLYFNHSQLWTLMIHSSHAWLCYAVDTIIPGRHAISLITINSDVTNFQVHSLCYSFIHFQRALPRLTFTQYIHHHDEQC